MSALIECRNLTKTYQMGDTLIKALAGVSISIKEGEYVAVMGASGSGKSTFMNLLGALDVPTSGDLDVAGNSLSELNADALADFRSGSIGFVFQQFNLLPRTPAVENVALPLVYAGIPAAERNRRALARLETGWPGRAQSSPSQNSSPVVSNSVSPLPVRWSMIRQSSWPMNPQARWTVEPRRR